MTTFNNKFVQQFERFTSQLNNQTDSFTFVSKNLDFFINFFDNQFENSDQSISISLQTNQFPIQFSTLNFGESFPSRIVYLNTRSEKNISVEISFRHLYPMNSNSVCAYLHQHQWKTEACQLKLTNLTHSICVCQTTAHIFGLITKVKETEFDRSFQLNLFRFL